MKIGNVVDFLEHFRTYDREMPVQTMLAFLYIAQEPGVSLTKLAAKLDVVLSTASRNVLYLSDIKRPGFQGHGLVSTERNPENRRENVHYLTSEGEKFYARLQKILG